MQLRSKHQPVMVFWLVCLFSGLTASLSAQGTRLVKANSSEIIVENCARINNGKVQFGPAIYGDELVYLTRPRAGNIDPVTKQTFFKLFKAPLNPDGYPGKPKRFSTSLSSNYHEGPVSFTQEDRVIFFTRTIQKEGVTVEDGTGVANLGIYSAYRALYDWADVRSLPFNGTNFSNQHPSVTSNGKRVFFASNRAGGYGGYDLYFSDYFEGRWSPAINMGPEVNTEGNENYPHIHGNGQLFFSSNGHGGLGGYDLFMIDLSERRWGKLVNLPEPVNSPADDISLTLAADGKRAYLASNREGGMGKDDIYLLQLKRGVASLRGPEVGGETLTLYDGANSRRVSNALVWLAEADPAGRLPAAFYSYRLEDQTTGRQLLPVVRPIGQLPASTVRTDREGSLRLELKIGKTYELIVHKNGYTPETLRFVYTEDGPSRPLAITLQPAACRVVSGHITEVRGGALEGIPIQFRAQNCNAASLAATTDVAGNYEICVPAGCDYLVTSGRAGYETAQLTVTADRLLATERPQVDLSLRAEGNVGHPGAASQDAVMPLRSLSFYNNTAILQEDISRDVVILQQLLTQRPDMKLLLIAHTDGPQSAPALQKLGEQRAVALREALVQRGIALNRLKTVSYGNSQRLSVCDNCGPADYAANNRMEAKVIRW